MSSRAAANVHRTNWRQIPDRVRPMVMRLLLWRSAVSCRGDEIKMSIGRRSATGRHIGSSMGLETKRESPRSLPRRRDGGPGTTGPAYIPNAPVLAAVRMADGTNLPSR
jgi:hypothetical protein